MHLEEQSRWLRLLEKTLLIVVLVGVAFVALWLLADPDASMVMRVIGGGVLAATVGLFLTKSFTDRLFAQTLTAAVQGDNTQFLALYEQSPTALITIKENGTIVTFNPMAVKLLGTTTDDLKGMSFYDLVISHTGHDQSILPSKIKGGITMNEEELLLHTVTGKEVWVHMSAYAEADKRLRVISLVDVTQAKKIDTAKTEFVALATHQLRTPIAAIRYNFELFSKKFRNSAPPEELEPYLDRIGRNTMRMISLIDDFLSVSQLETGTFAASEETFSLSKYIDGILDEYAEKISGKNIKVSRQETPADFQFKSDSRLFHIIVSNLISNAVKYLRQDGNLAIHYEARSDRLVIKIADDGIGIPQKDQEQLFKRFFRASNARTHQTEGTGLGLYIVKQAVEQLGGTITVESAEDKGAAFTVTLPVR